jgi:hypothetical protein
MPSLCKRANLANDMHTSVVTDATICSIKLPACLRKEPVCPDFFHVSVMLHDVLIVARTKMWTIDQQQMTIKVRNALKFKGRIALLPLCTIMVAHRAIRPLYMDNVHASHTTEQSILLLVMGYLTEHSHVAWQRDVLVLHNHKCIKK